MLLSVKPWVVFTTRQFLRALKRKCYFSIIVATFINLSPIFPLLKPWQSSSLSKANNSSPNCLFHKSAIDVHFYILQYGKIYVCCHYLFNKKRNLFLNFAPLLNFCYLQNGSFRKKFGNPFPK